MKNIRVFIFLPENFQFLVVTFSIYLNWRDFENNYGVALRTDICARHL